MLQLLHILSKNSKQKPLVRYASHQNYKERENEDVYLRLNNNWNVKEY